VTDSHPYVWRWRRWRPPGYGTYVPHVFADRFGQRCRVLARGRSMNSVAIEFAADGLTAVVSSRALRRADDRRPARR
jgi:hypothetical protein